MVCDCVPAGAVGASVLAGLVVVVLLAVGALADWLAGVLGGVA